VIRDPLSPEKPTRVAAPSLRASLRRRTICGRTEQRRPPVSKRYEAKIRMVWGSLPIALQQRSKHPREMVITPKASNSLSAPRFFYFMPVSLSLVTRG